MLLLWMWLISEVLDGPDEVKKKAGTIEVHMHFLGRWPGFRVISSPLALSNYSLALL